jgi:hypothetical protein
MTKNEFMRRLTNSKTDFLADFVGVLKKSGTPFCVIGGLAVNAYVEPVVSLDLDVVLAVSKLPDALKILKKRYTVKDYPNSINISASDSDLRIQIQTDSRYQEFVKGAKIKDVLGYRLPVARIEDVFQGKIWAATDSGRRGSKRQKDLADIQRMMESKPALVEILPESLKKIVNGLNE